MRKALLFLFALGLAMRMQGNLHPQYTEADLAAAKADIDAASKRLHTP